MGSPMVEAGGVTSWVGWGVGFPFLLCFSRLRVGILS
jgi:hypothetical protein